MDMRLAPEFRLLLLAVQAYRAPERAGALEGAAAAPLDWAVLSKGAHKHGLSSQLLAVMGRIDTVPPHALEDMRRRAVKCAAVTLARIEETVRVSEVLQRAETRFLVLKGATLSVQLHGNAGVRDARDVDVLVDASQIALAGEALRTIGYVPLDGDLMATDATALITQFREIKFVHRVSGTCVELHRRLTDNRALLDWEFDTLWREREMVRVGTVDVPTLARHRLLPYLCVHGAIHCWERLLWLGDLAAIVSQHGANVALEQAREVGLEALALHAMALASDWLGSPMPDELRVLSRRNWHVRYLDFLSHRFFSGARWHESAPPSSMKRFVRFSVWLRLYRYGIKPDWRYWRSEVAGELVSTEDHKAFRFPDRLHFLYVLVRPTGWLIRRLK
jgi:hypothetical protein